MELRDRLLEHASDSLLEMGTYVVDVEVGFSKARAMLRFFIDWDDPERKIQVQDCSRAAHLLRQRIEEFSLVGGEYGLEVSSPGVDRRITLPRDFVRFEGSEVKLKIRNAIDGQRNFEGVITDPDERGFVLVAGEDKIAVTYDNVARGNLVYKF